MAPTFTHGKGATVIGNQYALSSAMNDVSLSQTADTADVTVFGLDDRAYLAGLRDGTMSLTGFCDGSTLEMDRRLQAMIGSDTSVFSVGPSGNTVGDPCVLLAGPVTAYDVSSPATDVVAASASVQFSSQASDGFWLASLATRSAAVTGSAVTLSPSTATTGGAAGHLHVTGGTTSQTATVELSVIVQDSSDGVTWADYITFTDIDSTNPAGYERKTSTASCNEYVRAHVDAQGSTSITYAVAFARY